MLLPAKAVGIHLDQLDLLSDISDVMAEAQVRKALLSTTYCNKNAKEES